MPFFILTVLLVSIVWVHALERDHEQQKRYEMRRELRKVLRK